VGNARGNLCLISGDKFVANAGGLQTNLMAVLAVYGPPIVGAQSHLAVDKVPSRPLLHFFPFFTLVICSFTDTLWWPVPRLHQFKHRDNGKTRKIVSVAILPRQFSLMLMQNNHVGAHKVKSIAFVFTRSM
jgi:hypothetical protein